MIYIRKKGLDTWHWRRDCRHWENFRTQGLFLDWVAGVDHSVRERKPSGDLCNECKSKERRAKRGK